MSWLNSTAVLFTLALLPIAAHAQQSMKLLDVDSQTRAVPVAAEGAPSAPSAPGAGAAVPAGAPAAPVTARQGRLVSKVAFDLKFTKKVALAGWVSAGAGFSGRFTSKEAASGGERLWSLTSLDAPAYGVVRYNSWGKGNLHVRHLAAKETDAVLTASGNKVLADWMAHYGRVGLSGGDLPTTQGPLAARNWYEGNATAVTFLTSSTGLITAAATNRTAERSQQEDWKTNAWPAFAQMSGAFVPAPTTNATLAQILASQTMWKGPDASASIASLIAAARAMMPKYANKIPAVTAQNLVPQFTARRDGTRWAIVGTVPPRALGSDGKLETWRRELTVDESGRVTRDKLTITLTLDNGRVEATINRAEDPAATPAD